MEFFKKPKPIGFDYTPGYYKGEKPGIQGTFLNKGFLTNVKKRQAKAEQKKLVLYRFLILLILSLLFIFFLSEI